MSRLRVAMVLPGIGRVERGAEVAFLELAKHLAVDPDTHVELFGAGPAGLPGVAGHVTPCRPRERFERWPAFPAFRSECYYEEFSYALNLARSGSYRPADFDVVLGCTFPWVNWYLRWAGRKKGPLLVHVTQNGDYPCQGVSREFRHFRCDGLVCVNLIHYERHRDRYPSALIPNGIDPKAFAPRGPGAPALELPGLPPGAGLRTVLAASALVPSKGVDVAVRAAALVPDAYLVVAGDGPERSRLSALAGELLPGRHRFLGGVKKEQMPALYRAADAFLHASRDEPFGIVYLEAAASGLPVVAHDGPVPRWILGDAAVFADAADPEALADGLRRALEPEAAATLGRLGRARVLSGFTWEAQAARYRTFFQDLLSSRPEARSARSMPA